MSTLFIGIGHKKQQGKDAFATMLDGKLTALGVSCEVTHFADPLKAFARSTLGLTASQCHGNDIQKNSMTRVTRWDLGFPGSFKDLEYLTAREVLQHLGVQMRKLLPGIWAKAPFKSEYYKQFDVVLVPDLRFPDEAALCNQTIKIIRPGWELTDEHESENALNDYRKWDSVIVNDGTLDHLDTLAEGLAQEIKDKRTVNDVADTTCIRHAMAGPLFTDWHTYLPDTKEEK